MGELGVLGFVHRCDLVDAVGRIPERQPRKTGRWGSALGRGR